MGALRRALIRWGGGSSRLGRRVARLDADVEGIFDRRFRGDPVADRVFYAASELGDFSLIWLILAGLRGLRPGERNWRAAMRVFGAMPIESMVVNWGVKSLFRRRRPVWEGVRPYRLRTPLTSSFPSGHATSAFAAATLLAEGDVLAPLYYAIAVVVAASRIHVKIHHASDVLAGAAIGLVLGRTGRRLYPLDPAVSQEQEFAPTSGY